ncbi:MAG: undecaprenyl-phosphate glucose phosphotransferase [Spirochaetales bacterium]|nr:undecaprenyl-phosphate glucose phosphotransferase [Spirochaetales bacterium]
MLKKHERTFSFMQQLADAAAIAAAWLFSYYIRFEIIGGAQAGLGLFYLNLTPLIILLTLPFYFRSGLYDSNRYYSWHREILSVMISVSKGLFSFIILFFFAAPSRLSRITLMLYAIMALISTISTRLVSMNIIKSLRSKGKNLRHIILVGSSQSMMEYVEAIYHIKGAGLCIVGWVDSEGTAAKYKIPELKMSDISTSSEITIDSDTTEVDAVIISYPPDKQKKQQEALKISHKLLTPIFVLPYVAYTFIGNRIEDFEGIPMVKVNAPSMSIFDILVKRLLDIGGSAVGLLLLSPLLLIIAIAVKVTSKGPVFYGQERMSLDGEKFKMWKFRSMRIDAEEKSGAVWTVENDDRRTPIGAFLRSTSLDELPQLWNVFIGNMSLVGPRPERPVFVEKFKDEIPAYMIRHKMKAGITGWAQANGWRGNTSLEKRIEFDIYYIKHWSLLFDFKIIFLTFLKGFVNKNAY